MCKSNIIQNNSLPKPNYNVVSSYLKNMSLGGNGARGDTKCQNFNSVFFFFLKKGKYLKKEVFSKPI